VSAALILLAVLGVPYVALNVRRLCLGRRWAFTLCQAAKEWEERDRAKRHAARFAARASDTVRELAGEELDSELHEDVCRDRGGKVVVVAHDHKRCAGAR
jgi:hypothetical protein